MRPSPLPLYLCLAATLTAGPLIAADQRQLVELPPMMQAHMMSNMRDHLRAIDEILIHLSQDEPDAAAEVAEQRLGMSSLDDHGAQHMGQHMPEAMREVGTGMHRAASRFARTAEEGDAAAAYAALTQVTTACVSCHDGFRIR